MKRVLWVCLCLLAWAGLAWGAYHHMGEIDSANFLAVHPDKAGTKLDSCALCHTGGTYESGGKKITVGSCQWCHYKHGYDKSGPILETLNAYGLDYLRAGRNAEAVRAIESLDSDGDGYANLVEIQASRYPGNAGDDPTKTPPPSVVLSRAQLEAMPQHGQFLLLNTTKSGDAYAAYSGVTLEYLLNHVGVLPSATGLTVFSPDGFSQYHPLDPTPGFYHVRGTYPAAVYDYDLQADKAKTAGGWCDYSSPSCQGRTNGQAIEVVNGLRNLLAVRRDGAYLDAGVLDPSNKLNGEGPFRVVTPQTIPGPPDQASTAANQNVVWPYNKDWDHNAGAATRSATMIRVEPLPAGTTDIDSLEAGWSYVDEAKIIIYGAISGQLTITPGR